MTNVTLVALLHRHVTTFPCYTQTPLNQLLSSHTGAVWLPPLTSHDVTALHAVPTAARLHTLPTLAMATSQFPQGDSTDAGLAALASYDAELLDNLAQFWLTPSKINHPISDSLFELRHQMADEAHQGTLTSTWEKQLTQRGELILAAAKQGAHQLCFIEIEAIYWLRHYLAEQLSGQTAITLHAPDV
ncbi:MAG: hypothetical protein ACRCYV_05585 [Aeromonas sp.]